MRVARSITIAASSFSTGNGIDMCGRSSVSSTTSTGSNIVAGLPRRLPRLRAARWVRGFSVRS
jgi:hypothetical protein